MYNIGLIMCHIQWLTPTLQNTITKENHDNNKDILNLELLRILNISVVVVVFISCCILQVWAEGTGCTRDVSTCKVVAGQDPRKHP